MESGEPRRSVQQSVALRLQMLEGAAGRIRCFERLARHRAALCRNPQDCDTLVGFRSTTSSTPRTIFMPQWKG